MEQLSSAEISLFTRYYRAKKTSIEMATDRGFDVGNDKEILDFTLENFIENTIKETGSISLVRSSLNREYRDAKGRLLVIRFEEPPETSQQGVDYAKEFIKSMSETTGKLRFGISIVERPLSHDAKELIKKKYEFRLQVFHISDLQYNPTRHMFAANKYTSMSSKEQRNFLQENRIKPKQLPSMSFEDPIVRYFGFQIGQVIRKNLTSLTSETLNDEFIEYCVIDSNPI